MIYFFGLSRWLLLSRAQQGPSARES